MTGIDKVVYSRRDVNDFVSDRMRTLRLFKNSILEHPELSSIKNPTPRYNQDLRVLKTFRELIVSYPDFTTSLAPEFLFDNYRLKLAPTATYLDFNVPRTLSQVIDARIKDKKISETQERPQPDGSSTPPPVIPHAQSTDPYYLAELGFSIQAVREKGDGTSSPPPLNPATNLSTAIKAFFTRDKDL